MKLLLKPPPLSLLQLAATIPEHEVEILDLNVNPYISLSDLEKKISKFDLIGMTCNSNMVKSTLSLCRIAKRNGVRTVCGGFHPTLMPDMIKEPDIDFIVRGEGEITFRELVNGLDPKRILGLSYKENGINNGKIYHNKPRPLIQNLDELPFPRKDLIDYSKYHYFMLPIDTIETSRGCSFDCSFCCVTRFYGRTWRKKSIKRVIQELSRVPKTQKLVFFVDDNFTQDPERIESICNQIGESGYDKRFIFICQTRVDYLAKNPEIIQLMAKIGFVCFFVGIESLKQTSLNTMNKRIELNQIRKAIRNCHDNGIILIGSFIIGNIGETREDTLQNFQLMKKLGIDFIMTNPLIPYPGTKLWEEAVENGWIDQKFEWKNWDVNANMNTPNMSAQEIKELQSLSIKYFYGDVRYTISLNRSLKLYKKARFIKLAAETLVHGLKNLRF